MPNFKLLFEIDFCGEREKVESDMVPVTRIVVADDEKIAERIGQTMVGIIFPNGVVYKSLSSVQPTPQNPSPRMWNEDLWGMIAIRMGLRFTRDEFDFVYAETKSVSAIAEGRSWSRPRNSIMARGIVGIKLKNINLAKLDLRKSKEEDRRCFCNCDCTKKIDDNSDDIVCPDCLDHFKEDLFTNNPCFELIFETRASHIGDVVESEKIERVIAVRDIDLAKRIGEAMVDEVVAGTRLRLTKLCTVQPTDKYPTFGVRGGYSSHYAWRRVIDLLEFDHKKISPITNFNREMIGIRFNVRLCPCDCGCECVIGDDMTVCLNCSSHCAKKI